MKRKRNPPDGLSFPSAPSLASLLRLMLQSSSVRPIRAFRALLSLLYSTPKSSESGGRAISLDSIEQGSLTSYALGVHFGLRQPCGGIQTCTRSMVRFFRKWLIGHGKHDMKFVD